MTAPVAREEHAAEIWAVAKGPTNTGEVIYESPRLLTTTIVAEVVVALVEATEVANNVTVDGL